MKMGKARPANSKVGQAGGPTMSIEDTRPAMDAYSEGLLGGGPCRRHFSDAVVVSIVGPDQGAEGPDGFAAWIDYPHRVAFEARPELKNMIVGGGQAVG